MLATQELINSTVIPIVELIEVDHKPAIWTRKWNINVLVIQSRYKHFCSILLVGMLIFGMVPMALIIYREFVARAGIAVMLPWVKFFWFWI